MATFSTPTSRAGYKVREFMNQIGIDIKFTNRSWKTNKIVFVPFLKEQKSTIIEKYCKDDEIEFINIPISKESSTNDRPILNEEGFIIGSHNYPPSTNETLEEVANAYKMEHWCDYDTQDASYDSFIAGYKHCEKTMYSENELLYILQDYKNACDYMLENEEPIPDVKEWFEPKHFNKKLNPNN